MQLNKGIIIFIGSICLLAGCSKAHRVQGPFSNAKSIQITLSDPPATAGLVQVSKTVDGTTYPTNIAGMECHRLTPRHPADDAYIYFQVAPSFKTGEPIEVKATVEYFDNAPTTFYIEFDGSDPTAKHNGAYSRPNERVHLAGTQQWKTADFVLRGCKFERHQNGLADLRIRVVKSDLFVRSVTIEKK